MGLEVATIGVYGFDGERFLGALREAGVGLVLDLRRRRGVRGSEYAWANATRLQRALAEAGIGYRHHPELAPTTEMIALQQREDARLGLGQRTRTALSPDFRERYTAEVLDRVDLAPIVAALPAGAVTALLCVEGEPAACHRSIVAERLAAEHDVSVSHIRPGGGVASRR